MGYSEKMIKDALREVGYKSASLKKVKNLIKDYFGTIEDARSLLMDPVIEKIDKDWEPQSVYDVYKRFFIEQKYDPKYKREIQVNEFIYYSQQGYTRSYLAKVYRTSDLHVKQFTKELIRSQFPYLEQVFRKHIDSITYEELQRYLMAPIALHYLLEKKMDLATIGEQFKSPSNPNGVRGSFIQKIFTSVFRKRANQIELLDNYRIIDELIKDVNYKSLKDFTSDPSLPISLPLSVAKLERYVAFYSTKTDPTSQFEAYKIAIIGSYLENCYRVGLSPKQIADRTGFFSNEKEVRDWTQKIFLGLVNPQAFFGFSNLREDFYLNEHGVIINPKDLE